MGGDRVVAATLRAGVADEAVLDGDPDDVSGWLRRLCRMTARELPADGVAVAMADSAGGLVTTAASDGRCARVEDLQRTLGEGPARAAYDGRTPVLVPDLMGRGQDRWPAFAIAAGGLGLVAAFAFPLQVGAARVGVLDLYRGTSGRLSRFELSWAQTCAEVATEEMLASHATRPTGDEEVHQGPEGDLHFEVYQAQGMVMVQLGVDLETSLVRLRAHAFATDRALLDVARDVVRRRLVLTDLDR